MVAAHPLAPARTTLMIKPVGGLCNLNCTYCYYLPTIDQVYGGHERRMSLQTLESVFAGYLPGAADDVTIAWQGGEPTLAGLTFFEQAMAFQKKHARPGQRIAHAVQTNGTLLNADWCRFLHEHKFLVGISIDGLGDDHDHYRVDHHDKGTYKQVLAGLKLLRKHQVEHNILCVLNDRNVKKPRQVFNALLNLGEKWMQFIPAIEWAPGSCAPGSCTPGSCAPGSDAPGSCAAGDDPTPTLVPFSPDPDDYGRFLCEVFDLWFDQHRDKVSVRHFDAILGKLVHGNAAYCILDGACHSQLTVEHNGDLFGCDHYVQPRWQLGQITPAPGSGQRVSLTVEGGRLGNDAAGNYAAGELDTGWMDRADAQKLGEFAARKQHLPEGCLTCEWKALCDGGCPKHRPHRGDVPEPTVLCRGYKRFNAHAMMRLEWLASYLRAGVMPPAPDARPRAGSGASSRPRVKPRSKRGRRR